MIPWHLLFPRSQVSSVVRLIRDVRAVLGYHKLPDLQLRIRDCTAGYTCVGRAIETAVEDVLAPARGLSGRASIDAPGKRLPSIPVVLVDVEHAAVVHHDIVWRSFRDPRELEKCAEVRTSTYVGRRAAW